MTKMHAKLTSMQRVKLRSMPYIIIILQGKCSTICLYPKKLNEITRAYGKSLSKCMSVSETADEKAANLTFISCIFTCNLNTITPDQVIRHFFYQKLQIFMLFLHENICCGYS